MLVVINTNYTTYREKNIFEGFFLPVLLKNRICQFYWILSKIKAILSTFYSNKQISWIHSFFSLTTNFQFSEDRNMYSFK